jgi:hypothetical protein
VPRAEQLPDENDLSYVVCIVVGDEHGFAEDGLAVAVGDFGE